MIYTEAEHGPHPFTIINDVLEETVSGRQVFSAEHVQDTLLDIRQAIEKWTDGEVVYEVDL